MVGVEVVQKAIEDFFAEQKIPFTSQAVPAVDGTLFQVVSLTHLFMLSAKQWPCCVDDECTLACTHVCACLCVICI